jgi:hypothetical protein
MLILASASLVFAAAVGGTLAHRLLMDEELQCEYARIQERAHTQPSIHVHLLVDGNGVPPTTNEYLVIRGLLLSYLCPADQELAWRIDNVFSPRVTRSASASGYRKYL